jgi:S-adenosylmethionine/arginine decarboxylase-like enzyme
MARELTAQETKVLEDIIAAEIYDINITEESQNELTENILKEVLHYIENELN